MSAGQPLSRSQRLMSQDTLKKMGDELIQLCDKVEKHGLVDYQYGVWEEQIETSRRIPPLKDGGAGLTETFLSSSSRGMPRSLRAC